MARVCRIDGHGRFFDACVEHGLSYGFALLLRGRQAAGLSVLSQNRREENRCKHASRGAQQGAEFIAHFCWSIERDKHAAAFMGRRHPCQTDEGYNDVKLMFTPPKFFNYKCLCCDRRHSILFVFWLLKRGKIRTWCDGRN